MCSATLLGLASPTFSTALEVWGAGDRDLLRHNECLVSQGEESSS